MLNKDFNTWYSKKKALQANSSKRFFYEKEVWWASIGVNLGDEEDGKGNNFARPVLVIRKFNKHLFLALPLSTTSKRGRYYFELNINGIANVAILSQLKALDRKRLINKMAVIDNGTYAEVKAALRNLL